MTAFRRAIPALLISIVALAQPAHSRELFDDEKPPAFSMGQSIYSDDTMGGYQIYAGNGMWQFENASIGWSGGRADSIPMGVLRMTRWEGDQIAAVQTLVTNIRGNNGAYWSGNPCEGEHLTKRNRGRGRFDDCMRIDVVSLNVQYKTQTFLRVYTVQSNTGGRYYEASMQISAAYLGFPGTGLADWDSAAVQVDPAKSEALAKLTRWAELYQEAAAEQMAYRKPADTFAAVPPLRDLRPAGAPPLHGSFPVPRVNSGASYVFCETTKSMVREAPGSCPAVAPDPAVPMIQIVKERSASYVYCESSKSMVMEGAGDCPKPKR